VSQHNSDFDPLPVVIQEDDPIHVGSYPFCADPACPCHEESDFINGQVAIGVEQGLLTPAEATNIVSGKQVYQDWRGVER